MKTKILIPFLITALFITIAQLSHAASFNCAKAASKVEKMICSDSNLSRLDEEMATVYKKVLQMPSNQPDMWSDIAKDQQRNWLKYRNECQNIICLKKVYKAKLIAYKGFIADEDPSLLRHYIAKPKDIKRWDKPLCDAFQQYLDSFPLKDNYLGCGLKPSLTFKDFTFPQWQKLDPRKYSDVLNQINYPIRFTPLEMKSLTDQEKLGRLLKSEPGYELYTTKIDVDNDGKLETIYRQDNLICKRPFSRKAQPNESRAAIFNSETNEVNPNSLYREFHSNFFFYQGKTYSAAWGTSRIK